MIRRIANWPKTYLFGDEKASDKQIIWRKFLARLSKDLLISLVITYFLLLIPELILPGVVSTFINPKKVLILLSLVGLIFAYLNRPYAGKDNPRFRAISRNLLNIILILIMLLLILSLYRMKVWQVVIVAIVSLLLFISTEKMVLEDQES